MNKNVTPLDVVNEISEAFKPIKALLEKYNYCFSFNSQDKVDNSEKNMPYFIKLDLDKLEEVLKNKTQINANTI